MIRAQGPGAFSQLLDSALPLWDVLWEREVESAVLDSPDGQAAFFKRMQALASVIPDTDLRKRYQVTARIQVSDYVWRLTRSKIADDRGHKSRLRSVDFSRASDSAPLQELERIVLGMCIHFPDMAGQHIENMIIYTNFIGSTLGHRIKPSWMKL